MISGPTPHGRLMPDERRACQAATELTPQLLPLNQRHHRGLANHPGPILFWRILSPGFPLAAKGAGGASDLCTTGDLFRKRALFSLQGGGLSGRTRSIRPAPIIALFAKRQRERVPKPVVVRRRISGDADFNFRLGNIQANGAMQLVPPPKDHSEIGVRFTLHLGMMNAMHSRGDQNFVQPPFQTNGKSQIAMMKKCVGLEHEFINRKCRERHANKADLR